MCASLVAHKINNPPAMHETWVESLGGEDCLEKGKATHSSILEWEILWTEEPVGIYIYPSLLDFLLIQVTTMH